MAGVDFQSDQNLEPTWERQWKTFTNIVMGEILDNTPQEKKANLFSQLNPNDNRLYALNYNFKKPGDDKLYTIHVDGKVSHNGDWQGGDITSIGLYNPNELFEIPFNGHLFGFNGQDLNDIEKLFSKAHENAIFQHIAVKEDYEEEDNTNEEGAFTSYITCTPDGYLFRTSK